MTEEKKEITTEETTMTETAAETQDAATPETSVPESVSKDETVAPPEATSEAAAVVPSGSDNSQEKPAAPRNGEGPHHGYDDDRRRDSRPRGGGYGGRRGDRPLSNEDKVKIYKKQSEERLLDIKRSREDKIGKKRKR